jgi:hypothetical protein
MVTHTHDARKTRVHKYSTRAQTCGRRTSHSADDRARPPSVAPIFTPVSSRWSESLRNNRSPPSSNTCQKGRIAQRDSWRHNLPSRTSRSDMRPPSASHCRAAPRTSTPAGRLSGRPKSRGIPPTSIAQNELTTHNTDEAPGAARAPAAVRTSGPRRGLLLDCWRLVDNASGIRTVSGAPHTRCL